jgi:hypothetical protein
VGEDDGYTIRESCTPRPGAPSACIDEPSHAGPGGLSDLVRLVAASDARVTLLFGRGCIRRDDPSARRVAPTPRHLPYGARSARRTRVAPTCRAAATHRSRSRVRASLTRQTHTSRGVAPTKSDSYDVIKDREVSLRHAPTRPTCPPFESPPDSSTRQTPRLNAARAVDCGATLTTPLLMSLSDATCFESERRAAAPRKAALGFKPNHARHHPKVAAPPFDQCSGCIHDS